MSKTSSQQQATSKEEILHFDRIGQKIEIGDIVAAPVSKSSLMVGRIKSMGEKMATLTSITQGRNQIPVQRIRKYKDQIIKLSDIEETVLYLLRRD